MYTYKKYCGMCDTDALYNSYYNASQFDVSMQSHDNRGEHSYGIVIPQTTVDTVVWAIKHPMSLYIY